MDQLNIQLKQVDADNWYECTRLTVTKEQKRHFPVSAVYWLAESAYCGFYPLAIYDDEQLAGLAIYAQDPEDGSYWIMAFMIDKAHQNRGIGKNAMRAVIEHMRKEHNLEHITIGHRHGNEVAARLYEGLGFLEVERNRREVIRRLHF